MCYDHFLNHESRCEEWSKNYSLSGSYKINLDLLKIDDAKNSMNSSESSQPFLSQQSHLSFNRQVSHQSAISGSTYKLRVIN